MIHRDSPGLCVLPIPSPVTAQEACQALQDASHPFLLDSGMQIGNLGRYSFVGADPFLTIRAKGDQVEIETEEGVERRIADPLAVLAELLDRYACLRGPEAAEWPFAAGAVGYLSYDLCHLIERLPRTAIDDIVMPDLYFGFYDTALAFDHGTGACAAIAVDVGRGDCEGRARKLAEIAAQTTDRALESAPTGPGGAVVEAQLRCNFNREAYERAVARAIEYIYAGDMIQVNLSQRFSADISTSAWDLYRRLRAINPAPFAAYLGFPDTQVVSASPERFLKVADGRVETRPIKGTRPRGKTPEEDARLADELRGSAKDNAELVMIVDLERNDIGRVCKPGSVRVPELVVLESYPTVHHLVATVVGELGERHGPVDLIRATFPGGSITGAPKVRAMQIIDELEPTQRGLYTGSIGYIGFDGTMDLNIAIRTILVRGGKAHFQVGGGIVADSDPAAEYCETLDKGRALARALGFEI
jgi:para-aminobenzoate synthetase component 1